METTPMDLSAPRTHLLGRLAVWFAVCALPGCGRDSAAEPVWSDLTRGFEPRPMLEIARAWVSDSSSGPSGAVTVRSHENGSEVWIEATLDAADWTAGERPGEWLAARPRGEAFRRGEAEGRTRLAAGDRVFRRIKDGVTPSVGDYLATDDTIHIALEPDEVPAAKTTFGIRVGNGRAFGDTWRVRREGRVADGIAVWSGEREIVDCDIPPRSCLRLTTSWGIPVPTDGKVPRFRITLDGEAILDASQAEDDVVRIIELPADGRKGARLTFESDGPLGRALFLLPEIGPREVGGYADRPWGNEGRPNIIVYLADTFRSDNLAVGGGTRRLTPKLDSFAENSVAFTNARSVSSWTLPAISSLLTGMFPGQHSATDEDRTLAYELTTLAEIFAAHGYRTGAITDAAFFSQGYGLDQGFGWFAETNYPDWNVRRTTADALAFLDRDDGRPVFLIVHTYRVHAPYRRGADEDARDWEELMADGTRIFEEQGVRGVEAQTRVFLSFVDRFRDIYDDGVRDLDGEFGRFHSEIVARGVLERGYLVFTSDHGEAFGENGAVFHGKDLWDTRLRVPMLVGGGGLAPRRVERNVSLVDLPPTFAQLAGIAPLDEWVGRSILDDAGELPALAFLLEKTRKQLAIVEGTRKVFTQPDADALVAGEYSRAFDLELDPLEDENLEPDADWAAAFCRDHADLVRDSLTPKAKALVLGPSERPDLRVLGYGGE